MSVDVLSMLEMEHDLLEWIGRCEYQFIGTEVYYSEYFGG